MDPFLLDILRDSKVGKHYLKTPEIASVEKSVIDFTSCRKCKRSFKRLSKHLVQKENCKKAYTKEEIKTASKLKVSAKKQKI